MPHFEFTPRINIAGVNGYEHLSSSFEFLSELHYGIHLHIGDAIHVLDPFQVGLTTAGLGTRLCIFSEVIPITLWL